MHTIRNRRAANPPLTKSSKHVLPGLEPRKRKQPKLLNSTGQNVPGQPPSFPPSVAIPPPRGAVASAVTLVIPQATSMAALAAATKALPRKASAAKSKQRKMLRKRRAKPKPKLRQNALLPGKPAGQPAISLPKQGEVLVITSPMPQLEAAANPAPVPPVLHPPATSALAQPDARNNAATAPIVRSRALATHRPEGLLNHIATWLASRGRAIRVALTGKPRRAPQPKARLQPMPVQRLRRDPRQDELARLRQENHQLQLQVRALQDLQVGPTRPKEPV